MWLSCFAASGKMDDNWTAAAVTTRASAYTSILGSLKESERGEEKKRTRRSPLFDGHAAHYVY